MPAFRATSAMRAVSISASVYTASPGSGIGSPIARRAASRNSSLMPLRSATSAAV